ncbi:MAG: hypothetical protein NTX11_01925, partial [Candidatus Saccharibacteria bacterium]|nr:hypothetical protein [Candidatus Saccharibacteria bacterium]
MSRRRKKAQTVLIAGVVALILAAAQNKGYLKPATQKVVVAQPGLYQVTSFSDGDTFTVDMNGT